MAIVRYKEKVYTMANISADDPADSESSRWISDDFEAAYGHGETINGTWFNDTIGIGSLQFYDAQFAVANESFSAEGLLGLGYYGDASDVNNSYPGFPYLLYQKKLIECNAWYVSDF